jgi:2-polyprenyl-6-methoxyphenol hydroxylase-like FAD-dependent oxidoreductase
MRVPVLVIGAGPAGLTSSILLSRAGIRSLTVERHASTSVHPKATALSTRTMELFRAWGIDQRIRDLALPVEFSSSVRRTLSDPELERRSLGFPTADEASVFSPTSPAALAQDLLEPVLVDHARSYAQADVRFDTEVVDLDQRDGDVRVTLLDRISGVTSDVYARYVIAADGANSPTRRRLGIAMQGVERIGDYLSILFRADVASIVGPEMHGLYLVQALGGPMPAVVLPTSNDGRWILAAPWRDDLQPASSLTPADLVDLVRRAAGRADLDVELLGSSLIGIGAQVAERFRDGNVFLVGDAAHRTAPTGGTGMNTAIQAAHNLMWKLAAVLTGTAGPALLDTYEPERRPSGERNLLRSRGQLQGVSGVAADLGVVYSSGSIVAGQSEERPAVIEPTSCSCVGSRAPHVWLAVNGVRVSTLDLFGNRLTLLTGARGHAWSDAARNVAQALDIPLGAVAIDGHDVRDGSGRWLDVYGIEADGAVLVRPDGHIAWRSHGAAVDATATLEQVVARVLGFVADDRRAAVASLASDERRCA